MSASIRACIREKNRWNRKAMFTENHESQGRLTLCMVESSNGSKYYVRNKIPVAP
jgi:hypothetical protein